MKRTLLYAIAKVLRPLVRILIRYGVPYGDFNEVARRIFVEVAERDFPLPGRKQTKSRIAMLTGINRKEVSRLLELPPIELDQLDLEYNRGVRVTSGWRRDAAFHNPDGTPATLPFEGQGSFSELVRRYSGDLPARAVLDELVRTGTVGRDEGGMISLLYDDVHVPHADKEAGFNIMGNSGKDLFSTLDHNFECGPDETRLQLTVAYDNLPRAAVERFRHISHEDAMELLRKFDRWLAEHDRDANPDLGNGNSIANSDRYRAGIGIYYFEDEYK